MGFSPLEKKKKKVQQMNLKDAQNKSHVSKFPDPEFFNFCFLLPSKRLGFLAVKLLVIQNGDIDQVGNYGYSIHYLKTW